MGFAAGFQVGAQAVERGLKLREEEQLKKQLAEVYAKPQEYLDYTPEQTKEIQRLQATGAYDVEATPSSGGAAPTLRYTPRQGLDLGQGDMPAPPTEFAPQQVQRYGGQTVAGQFDPNVLRGLQAREAARVVGASGDFRGAAALEAQAAALEAQAEERAFQAKYRPLQLQSLEGTIAGQAQQRDLTGLQLKAAGRTEAELLNASNFATYAAENPNATTQDLKDAAFKQFKFTPDQWKKTVNTRLGIKEDEQKDFVLNIKEKLKGKNLTQLGSLYNSDPDFDDKTDLAIVPGKNGAVTLNFIDKATGKITTSQSFKNEASATEYLNRQATEPETIGTWMLNLKKVETGIAADEARIRASDAQTRDAGKSSVEKNLATLQRLGIAVSPEDVRAMAGIKQEKLSPEAAARLEVITASVKGNESPKALELAQTQITDLFKGEALKQRNTTIVRGLQTANTKNDLPAAIKQLQDAGVADETIVGLARQAGVTLPANFTPAAAPAPAPAPATAPAAAAAPAAAPAAYVPPANSPAAKVLANREQGLITQRETSAVALKAQAALSTQFAADSKVLSPLEMARKYNAVRSQLPTADAAALQRIERGIR